MGDVNNLTEQGLLRILAGDHAGALPLLEQAVALGATDPAILIELARAYRLQGRPRDAIRLLAPVVSDANEPAARYELTRAHLEAGDFQTALTASTAQIESLDLSAVQAHELPMLMDVYEVGAEAARGAGDSIRASVLYSALQSLLVRYNRRDLAEQARRLEQQHIREASEHRAQLAQVEDDAPQRHLTDLLADARRCLQGGLVFAAMDASYDALALDSMNLRPFIDIAAGYVTADQTVAAATLLRSVELVARLRGDGVDLAPAQRLLGRLAGEPALREQAVERWLEQGESAEAAAELHDLAEEAAAVADWVRAEARLRRALSLEPGRTATTLALARVLSQAGRPEEGLAVLSDADDRLRAGGRYDLALALWARAVTLLLDVAEARQVYGERLLQRGRPEEGAQQLIWAADSAARQGNEIAVDILLRAAQVYDEMDNLPAALRTYDRLLRQAPGNAQLQEHFVGFCLRRGRAGLAGKTLRTLTEYLLGQADGSSPTAAVASLTQLMVLRPDDAWAYERMAAILTQEDRPQEALMVYRQLVARRPHDQALADRVRELSGSMGASTPGPAAEG
ncbi:MAG: tetratricopeptide repeat protein [Chloroflexota bacterium]